MGTQQTYKCTSCGYSVVSSGGHDIGFVAVVDAYICKSCQEIVDVIVGQHGVTFVKGAPITEDLPLFDADDIYTCPICGSPDNLEKWGKRKRPCPKCDGKMEVDNSGVTVLWD